MRRSGYNSDVYYRAPASRTNLPYRVRTAGLISNKPYHSTLGTYNKDIMLTLYVAGHGTYRCAGNVIDVRAGIAGIVLPGPDVGVLMADPDNPYEHFYCRFSGKEAEKTARRIIRNHGGRFFFETERWTDCLDAFRQLVLMYKNPESSPERMRPVDALCAYILACMDNPGETTRRRITVANLEMYMQTHISEPSDLDRMAADFRVSKAHLCRAGHSLLGETLLKVWRGMKMEWAQHLLLDKTLLVCEVAMRVGFEDQFYFSRVFKSLLGQSPAGWRRSQGIIDAREPD